MPVEFERTWIGIAIPSVLIAYLEVSTVFLEYLDASNVRPKLFSVLHFGSIMIWISYYIAITVPPGSPPDDFKLPESEFRQPQTMWRKYCTKCDRYKPERAHHCRKCGKCVLRMDHHCPWTNNCIGYNNFPHFVRFVAWILITVTAGAAFYVKKLWDLYEKRNLPAYLFSMKTLVLYVTNLLLTAFILLTVGILFIRTISSAMSNETMIESWECERIQDNFFTEKFWKKIRSNYAKIYPNKPDPVPDLKSWKVNYRVLKKDTNIPLSFTYEDLVFPYDLGSSYENLVDAMGPIYLWFFPFGRPSGHGLSFVKDKLDEDQLKLPFPPDGSNSDPNDQGLLKDDDNELVIKNWANYMGETLNDFGVDMDTEDYEMNKSR
jgi:palmitoyltransferase